MPSPRVPARVRRLFALFALVCAACAPPEGPQPIVYDREPCAHCRMLISEPRFAAQLQTEDGQVLNFDDPGCLFAAIEKGFAPVRDLWFHHVSEERWLDAEHVAFAPTEGTPMGYGLGAVDVGSPGALSLAGAQARVAEASERSEPRR